MSAIYLLVGLSMVVATAFLAAFLWAVRHGQYEDSYTPAIRILFDPEDRATRSQTPDTSQEITTTNLSELTEN